jgi:hypothetical protein
MTDSKAQDSEFDWAGGPIAPPPHELTAAEQARLERKMSTSDPSDTIDAARLREGSRLT